MEDRTQQAYLAALLAEMEEEITRRTLSRVQVITRSMAPAEKEAYLAGKAFQNALNQTRKKDRLYQQIAGGDLPEDYQKEYERLKPLIQSELKHRHAVDLHFLRAALRTRRPLKQIWQARGCLERGQAAACLKRNAGRIAERLDAPVQAFLLRGDLAQLAAAPDRDRPVAETLMHGLFRRGIPQAVLDAAVQEKDFLRYLQHQAAEEYPALKSCAGLRLQGSKTVEMLTREQAREALPEVMRRVQAHFPARRIQKLLRQNQTLAHLQRRQNQDRESRQRLREALVKAMPEEIRDFYPLARQMKRRFVLHLGPTNSGKTWESIQRLQAARKGIYLGPLRLLAFEQFETLNLADVPCSLVTGEEQIQVPDSRVQSSTIEMADLEEQYDVAVIDECQMISDRDRGGAWTAAVLGLCAGEIHVCASPDAEELLTAMIRDCGDELSVVRHQRMAPLEVEEQGFHFPDGVRKGDALIVFAKARVHALAAELRQKGFSVSLIYGALPPDVRRNQAERFRRGETEIVVSTDAIAMGMNLPIRRVVFMEAEKYDGDVVRPLTDSEIRQIAGRAGRYGIYDVGYVNALGFRQVVAAALERPFQPLREAMLRFPESLLGLPLPLTEILNRWISMKDKDYFTKASTVRMASLAARMETPTTDKRLLYDFLCIPFDETEPELLGEWKAMYHEESQHRHYEVARMLPAFVDPEQCTVRMLDRLEADYRLCDLYYNYVRRFLEEPQELLRDIQQRKDLISSGIIHVLSTQKLVGRTCSQCGRHLPWNWPYSICDRCHFTRRY